MLTFSSFGFLMIHFRHRTQRNRVWFGQNLHPIGLPFIIPEGDFETAKGGKQSIVISSCDFNELQQRSTWQDIPKGATLARASWK